MGQAAFDFLDDKYGFDESAQDPEATEQPAEESQPLTDWKQSPSVCMLSAFLKEFNDQGIFLKQTPAGLPTLCFEPGIPDESLDEDRWAHASHAADLYHAAWDDLRELILNGALSLPVCQEWWSR